MLTTPSSPLAGWHLPFCFIPATKWEAPGLSGACDVQEQNPLSRGRGHSWEDDSCWIQKENKWSQKFGGNGVIVRGRICGEGSLPFPGNWLVKQFWWEKTKKKKIHLLIQEIRSLNLSLGKRGFSSPRK